MNAMTEANDNQSNQLEFPIQRGNFDDPDIDWTTLIQTIRLDAAKLLNAHAAGKIDIDVETYNKFKHINSLFAEINCAPLISEEELSKLL